MKLYQTTYTGSWN